ncbi:MAG: membrane integrity-associated transporter subunit PqiC [Deltaproteobacteria bacterium]|nr:membrane integrity-associated transporter subunit PqiC [Deltaproteobacteria bacterium]
MKKMKKIYWIQTAVILMFSLSILGGCLPKPSAPTKLYILSPLAGPAVEMHNKTDEIFMTIGVGPVHLPEYLDRPEIVTRINPNELKLAEFDIWAEPLQVNFTRVLIENISRLLSTEPVAVFPWEASPQVDFQIGIELVRLDGDIAGKAFLTAQWSILNSSNKSILFSKKSQYTKSVDGTDYSALVAAQSRMIGALSHDIAEAIKSLLR